MARHRTTVKKEKEGTWCVFDSGKKVSCHGSEKAARQVAMLRRGGK